MKNKKLIRVVKLVPNTKKTTKMQPSLRVSTKTLKVASGINIRPNPLISPSADIIIGFVCGSIQNTGEMDVYVRIPSALPDTNTTDDILTIKPGTIYNFEANAGRFYPSMVVTFEKLVEQPVKNPPPINYGTASCETIFWY